MVHLTSTHFCLSKYIIQLKWSLSGVWPFCIFFMIGYLFFPFSRWESEELTLTGNQNTKYWMARRVKDTWVVSAPQIVTSQINEEGGQGGKGEGYSLKGLMLLSAADFPLNQTLEPLAIFSMALLFCCHSFLLSLDWSSDLPNHFSKFTSSLWFSWKPEIQGVLGRVFFLRI